MKNSIARQVTRRIFVTFVIALLILFTASFWLVYDIIKDKTEEQNKSMVTAYSDMIMDEATAANASIDENLAERFLTAGEYICQIYDMDFAYLFVPDIESGKIKYICVSQNERFNIINPDDKYIGKVTEYKLTDDERAVWEGRKSLSNSITQSKTGYEISTMVRIKDLNGNIVMAGVDKSYENVRSEIVKLFLIIAITIIIVTCGLYFSVYYVIKRRVSAPAKVLSKAMNEYIKDGERSKAKVEIGGDDEFSMISSAFNSMTDNITEYLENISTLTHAQEQQNAQLDISSRIQRGFLKDEYFETGGCVIYADMIPAKYVAGDLYDYMPIGNNKFLTVIADVSGKGISASIFMAVTLMLIREFAKMNMSPTEILTRINNSLYKNNPSMLFLTAIVGIYDGDTKTYTYANAGHNLPYIIKDGNVTTLGGAQNTLLGIFPDEKFTENTVTLGMGDMLFLYTDGVNEAVNKDKEFFGIERLEKVLKDFTAEKRENIVDYVKSKVAEFVGDAERHDDITMLCFTPVKSKNLVLQPKESEFEKIKKEILSLPIERNDKLSLCLAAEEFFVNICSYAYTEEAEENVVNVSLNISNRITLRLSDSGMPFDPTENIIDIENYDIETQVGGLGRFIAVNNVDDAKYEYKNGKNILTLTKYLVAEEVK